MVIRLIAALSISVLLGCGTANENVLITVNGNSFTEEQLTREVELGVALLQHRSKCFDAGKIDRFRKMRRSTIIQKKLSELLLMEAVSRSKDRPSQEDYLDAQEKYAAACGKTGEKFSSLRGALPDDSLRRELDRQLDWEVRTAAFLNHNFSNDLAVTEQMIDDTIESMRRGDEKALATNKVIYATATNVWNLAKSGADFAKLADVYSQESTTEIHGDLGSNIDFTDFQSEETKIWNAVSKLQPGEVTPPLDMSDGLAIFKCLGRISDDRAVGGTYYHLARVVFRRAMLFENYDREFITKSLREDLRSRVIRKLVRHEAETADIRIVDKNHRLPKGYERQLKALKEL